MSFPGGSVGKESSSNAGDAVSNLRLLHCKALASGFVTTELPGKLPRNKIGCKLSNAGFCPSGNIFTRAVSCTQEGQDHRLGAELNRVEIWSFQLSRSVTLFIA